MINFIISALYLMLAPLSIIGAFNQYYKPNVCQQLGLGFICMWSLTEVYIMFYPFLNHKTDQVIAIGVGFVFLGTIAKTVKYYRELKHDLEIK